MNDSIDISYFGVWWRAVHGYRHHMHKVLLPTISGMRLSGKHRRKSSICFWSPPRRFPTLCLQQILSSPRHVPLRSATNFANSQCVSDVTDFYGGCQFSVSQAKRKRKNGFIFLCKKINNNSQTRRDLFYIQKYIHRRSLVIPSADLRRMTIGQNRFINICWH